MYTVYGVERSSRLGFASRKTDCSAVLTIGWVPGLRGGLGVAGVVSLGWGGGEGEA